ncbi:TPA: hypothetical protein RI779_003501 [Vibrio cholerae]|nr:hypothetical protein [Vibrio cholerae]HDV5512578.1 hypothetical protein [Vibrio cholerae]HDV5549632.1 hypothetical protein [Vibrio cholerae]
MLLDQDYIDSNFRKYHINTIKKWCSGECRGLTEELVLNSFDVLKNVEDFTLTEIAESTGLTLETVAKLNAKLVLV